MTDIIIQPNADADDLLTNAVVINDATLPLSNEDAATLGLTLGTTYKARVLGTPQTFSVTDVPAQASAPTLSVSGTTITVTMAANPADNGEAITSEDIRYSTDEATWTVIDAATDPYDITGLDATTLYYVQTRAVNINGEGEWSASATETTGAAPSAAISFVGGGSGVAAVSATTAISLPAGTQSGDLAIVVAGHESAGVSVPAGTDIFGTYTTNMDIKAVRLTGSETDIDVVNAHASKNAAVSIAVFRGITDPIGIVSGPGSYAAAGSTFYPPAQTSTASGQLLFWAMGINDQDLRSRWDAYLITEIPTTPPTPLVYLSAHTAAAGGANGENFSTGFAYALTQAAETLDTGVIDLVSGEGFYAVSIILE